MRLKGLVDAHASLSTSILRHLAVVSQRNDDQRVAAASTELSEELALPGSLHPPLQVTHAEGMSCLQKKVSSCVPMVVQSTASRHGHVAKGVEASQGSADAVAAEGNLGAGGLCAAQEEGGITVCNTAAAPYGKTPSCCMAKSNRATDIPATLDGAT